MSDQINVVVASDDLAWLLFWADAAWDDQDYGEDTQFQAQRAEFNAAKARLERIQAQTGVTPTANSEGTD